MEILFGFWIVCGIGAAFVASSRGASGCLWMFLGFLLGPIGLAMAFAAESKYKCPRCQSNIKEGTTRCPHCQVELRPVVAPKGYDRPIILATPIDDENARTQRLVDALEGNRPLTVPSVEPTKRCPDCAEDVKRDARKCRFCGYMFE